MTDSEPNSSPNLSPLQKLHSETAQISWLELQRFFAQGNVLHVADELDLVTTALWFAQDNTVELGPLIESQQVIAPSNDQARVWFDDGVVLWSVVVAPFVLVQNIKTAVKVVKSTAVKSRAGETKQPVS